MAKTDRTEDPLPITINAPFQDPKPARLTKQDHDILFTGAEPFTKEELARFKLEDRQRKRERDIKQDAIKDAIKEQRHAEKLREIASLKRRIAAYLGNLTMFPAALRWDGKPHPQRVQILQKIAELKSELKALEDEY